MKRVTETDLIAELRSRVERAKSLEAAARDLGASGTYIRLVLAGERTLGPKVLKGMGYRVVTARTYERIEP